MKSFLKYTLATIVGVIITGAIFFLILFASIGSMISSQQDKTVDIKPNTVLKMELNQVITDRSPQNPFENFDFSSFQPQKTLGLNDILNNIEKAKKDDEIKGIYLELSSVPAGIATTEEIREALIDFKESDKFIICYSDNYTQKSYYLGSVADKMYMNPAGRVYLTGLQSNVMFFKEGLDRLGVEPQIVRHGKFKSAIEPFTKNEMSPENREQISTYMNSLWNHMAKGISEHRGIAIEKINQMTNKLTHRNAEAAVELGLVDSLAYKDHMLEMLKEKSKIDKDKARFVSLKKYTNVPKIKEYTGLAKNKIAVVYAMGSVQMGEGEEGTIGSDRISRAIRNARKDTSIKAIVFRVNSGGGSALASEVIWREAQLAAKEKPFIASLGDVAASGGYYIVAPADTIMASPNTITGSIGVFGLFFNGKEFLNDKLGVHVDVVKTHRYSDLGSPFRSMREEERQIIKDQIVQTYETFVERVAEGRNMTKEKVDKIGQGRVWSGEDAKERGLVDMFGGLEEAVEVAAKAAKIEKYRTVGLPKLKDPFEQFMKNLSGNVKASIIKNEMGDSYRYYKEFDNIKNMQGIQARVPYRISVY
jgi:protease-4